MVGPDKPIDTDRYFVVCINSLGSCFGSTGPASINPETERPYRLDFPTLCLEDIARAGHAVVEALGIERLHAVVGASMGGMTALAFAMLYPDAAGGLVSISSACRSLPFSIAIRSLQREMIRSDPAWRDGHYAPDAPARRGHAPSPQARHDLVSLRGRVGHPLRARTRDGRRGRRRALRDRLRGRIVSGGTRREVRGVVRRQLLSLPLPGDGPIRRLRSRGKPRGRASPGCGRSAPWSSASRRISCFP